MTDLRKAAEMALELLENHVEDARCEVSICKTVAALRQALAESANSTTSVVESQALAQPEQKREWVGLTDEDLEPMCDDWRIVFGPYVHDFAKAIETKLKEKNGA